MTSCVESFWRRAGSNIQLDPYREVVMWNSCSKNSGLWEPFHFKGLLCEYMGQLHPEEVEEHHMEGFTIKSNQNLMLNQPKIEFLIGNVQACIFSHCWQYPDAVQQCLGIDFLSKSKSIKNIRLFSLGRIWTNVGISISRKLTYSALPWSGKCTDYKGRSTCTHSLSYYWAASILVNQCGSDSQTI